jgi:predicted house-cleaning noncanonical NTP pyrophosphatase (MazG superfamily)
MGWKIVRDNNEEFCHEHGISGQWRRSKDPIAALSKKILEEAGEFVEFHDPEELYDIRDVVNELLIRLDPSGMAGVRHGSKVDANGMFTRCIEWSPRPAE